MDYTQLPPATVIEPVLASSCDEVHGDILTYFINNVKTCYEYADGEIKPLFCELDDEWRRALDGIPSSPWYQNNVIAVNGTTSTGTWTR